MNELTLRLHSDVSLVVPASLDSITTYVLLEQEDWFEKEPAFLLRWLRPGMTVIDIGANLGVYSLPLARKVGPHGMVFAYEPGSEPRSLLERSRAINRADNLHVIAAAVSDRPREGQLVLGQSSELNSLEGTGPAESVWITALDAEDGSRGWSAIDFVKIDAEGEEERILDGGKSFFERHSPLVMFEIKAGPAINEALRSAFRARGYEIYRLLAGAPVLVPDNPGEAIDGYELNLFAAKPDRAAALAREGFLVESVPDWAPDDGARDRALTMLRAQAFVSDFGPLFTADVPLDPLYRDGLAGYAAWRSPDLALSERCGALDFACRTLVGACNAAPSLARLSSAARATWDAGQRGLCVAALAAFGELVVRGAMNLSEPFWPAAARFDDLSPGAKRAEWVLVSAFEQLERASVYSSTFARSKMDLDWLCAQPFVSAEMERRRVLQHAKAGERVEVPVRLCVAADDHVNADVWRAGLVPNTWVRDTDEAQTKSG
jgi:FkbM family methyltransferase